jgi:hypothetical protein
MRIKKPENTLFFFNNNNNKPSDKKEYTYWMKPKYKK